MNLFDILSAGKRDLNEENVSSFLAWILNPNQTHGCGNLFLSRLLNTIDSGKNYQWEKRLTHLSIDVVVEEEVTISNSARRYIDIVLIISSSNDTPESSNLPTDCNSIVFAIENKIRNSACKEAQLKEQIEGLHNSYKDSCIYFLYLTPNKNDNFKNAFNHLPENITKSHLSWAEQTTSKPEVSIINILRDILDDDSKAKIDPLSNELKFIVKSFIMFAENGFRSYSTKPFSIARTGNKYFKGTISGLDSVKELFIAYQVQPSEGMIYIGYAGGEKALYKQCYDSLINRNYKWDDNLTNKQKTNWISIERFIEIINVLESNAID